MTIGEAESTNQTDALIPWTGEAIANNEGAPYDAISATLEDLRHAHGGAMRNRSRDWLGWTWLGLTVAAQEPAITFLFWLSR